MIFSSHNSRMRILQLTFALVCSCSAGLLTTEKHRLVPFCFLTFPTTFIRGAPPPPRELVFLLSTCRTLRAEGLKPNKGKGKVQELLFYSLGSSVAWPWFGQTSNCGSTKGPAEVHSVIVPFYLWFKFYFSLFESHHRTLPHPEIKENKIWTRIISSHNRSTDQDKSGITKRRPFKKNELTA